MAMRGYDYDDVVLITMMSTMRVKIKIMMMILMILMRSPMSI